MKTSHADIGLTYVLCANTKCTYLMRHKLNMLRTTRPACSAISSQKKNLWRIQILGHMQWLDYYMWSRIFNDSNDRLLCELWSRPSYTCTEFFAAHIRLLSKLFRHSRTLVGRRTFFVFSNSCTTKSGLLHIATSPTEQFTFLGNSALRLTNREVSLVCVWCMCIRTYVLRMRVFNYVLTIVLVFFILSAINPQQDRPNQIVYRQV